MYQNLNPNPITKKTRHKLVLGSVLLLAGAALIANGLRTSLTGDEHPPVFFALATGDSKTAREIVQDDPDVLHATDPTGATPLHLVTAAGRRDLVELFLSHGADPNAADADGWTPLVRALEAPGDQRALVQTLLGAGARRDLTLAENQNVLHLAGFFRKLKPEVLPLLVPSPDALKARDASGSTPREVAVREGNRRIADALARLERGGNGNGGLASVK